MAITYGTLIGTNAVTITDPYHDGLMRGWMPEGLIYDQLFPQVPSKTYKGRIPHQNTPGQIRSDLVIAPDGFPSIRLDFDATTTYKLLYRGLTAQLDYADIEELGGDAMAINKVSAILDAQVQLSREYQVAASMTSTTTMTQNFAPTSKWSDPVNSDVLGDITKAISVVRKGIGSYSGCGFVPNVAVVPWEIYNYLRRHPQLIKAWLGVVTSGQKDFILDDKGTMLASIMSVDKVLIPKAMYYSNAVGATQTRADIWGTNVVFARVDYSPTPAEAKISLGYTFTPASPAVGLATFTYNWQTPGILPEMGKNVTRGYMADDHIVDVTAGCLLTSVI